MTTNAIGIVQQLTPDALASEISQVWTTYKNARQIWEAEMLEIRNFLYATDTRTTQAGLLPFKNSTTVPKLAQIATNLLANYGAHLFANPNWAQFEPFDKTEATKEQKQKVEAYARTKMKRKNYEKVLRQCLVDWINTGACFAQQRYVTETGVDALGNPRTLYQGAELMRLAPQDVAFDVTATSFKDSAKVIRKVFTLGDIARDIEENSETYFTPEMLEEMRLARVSVRASGLKKAPEGVDWEGIGLQKDGFGDLLEYMRGDQVEVLEFYGDIYSVNDGTFRKNHKVVVVDRRKIAYDEEISNENGSSNIYYVGWEPRPDNLMGMSPLARIVGMQYKLDKLENLRADVFDQMANPPTVEKGNVEFYGVRGAPGAKYVVDDLNGGVSYLQLPPEALQADTQIQQTMNIMEMMAGSPQNASGFRTPGEKTKFEVQTLEGGANRIFRDKVNLFETEFIEPIMLDLVELGRRNLGESDMVAATGQSFNVETFLSVSRDDLFVSGKMRARGSKLFAEKANALQNLNNIFSSQVGKLLLPHTSTKKLASAMEELGEFEKFGIFFPNIGIQEQVEQQMVAQSSQNAVADQQITANADEAVRIAQQEAGEVDEG